MAGFLFTPRLASAPPADDGTRSSLGRRSGRPLPNVLRAGLSSFAVVKQSTRPRALDRKEVEGLVRRDVAAAHGHATLVGLTDDRREVFDRLSPHMAQAHAPLFRDIPEEERRASVGTLQVLPGDAHRHDS